MTLAYAYLRVSGDEQADRGLPIAGQREEIERYAAAHGVIVTRWFVDEARPGSNDHRDGFQAMMRAAQATPAPVNAVILWSWSRFARSVDDAHYWKALLRRRGVEVVSLAEPIPDNLPAGMEYVLESVIHWSDARRLEEISHDSRRGQQVLARQGYIPSGCRPPRGYRVEFVEAEVNGKRRTLRRWVPDSETWPLAERAWRMRLGGASYQAILRECPGLYRSEGCLSTFFPNTVYKGFVTFGGTRIEVAAMVTPEEWAQVNRNRPQRGSGAYPRRQGSVFLLSGLVRCARCGAALVGHRSSRGLREDGYERTGWVGYRCPHRRTGECDLPAVTASALEGGVIAQVLDDVLTPSALQSQWAALREARRTEGPALEARIAALERDLSETDRAITRLLDAVEASPDSTALLGRLRGREAEREELLTALADARATVKAAESEAPDLAEFYEALRAALEARNETPAQLESARALLRQIVAEVLVDDGTAQVRYRVPF